MWDDGAPREARLPRRQPLLVVRDGRDDRLDGHAAADLPRRRRASRPTATRDPPELHDRLTGALGDVPALPRTGARRAGIASSKLDRRRGPASCSTPSRPTCCWSTCRTSTTTSSASAPTAPEAARGRARARRASLGAAARRTRARRGRQRRRAVASTASRRVDRPGRRQPRAAPRRPARACYTQAGMEYLDPWTSRAFAVADHQIAHVYVRDPADLAARARRCSPALPGRRRGARRARRKAAAGLDHERAGELVARRRAATPGSPTTTGSTTRGARLRAAASRSTASPATTRPSCSSTRPTGSVKVTGRARRSRARSSACATP